MANKSNWKGSERMAADLFPGGQRRTRVGGGTYAEIADDVIWGPEQRLNGNPPRVIKLMEKRRPPVYIEVKKRASNATVAIYKEAEKKYFRNSYDRLALVIHVKRDRRQFVMVSDDFFTELICYWCNKIEKEGTDEEIG